MVKELLLSTLNQKAEIIIRVRFLILWNSVTNHTGGHYLGLVCMAICRCMCTIQGKLHVGVSLCAIQGKLHVGVSVCVIQGKLHVGVSVCVMQGKLHVGVSVCFYTG